MTPEQRDLTGRIIQDPTVLFGKPVINGTRIAVDMVLEYLEDNPNLEEFFADYPEVTLADVQACLGYARKIVQETTPPRPTRLRRSRAVTGL
jgi:uncharacterized protein (DUF433 family)